MPLITRIPESARRVIIALNPKAGAKSGRPRVEALEKRLSEKGFLCEMESNIDTIARHSAQYLADGALRGVVSAGGDGTAALIVNETPPSTPVFVFPLGTENLLAKHLGIRRRVAPAARMIEDGLTLQMDAGTANGRLFLLMLGCGFDADVVHQVHSRRKGHIRRWSYFKPIISAIRRYRYPEIRLRAKLVDDESGSIVEQEFSAKWAFVANLPRYAGGLRVVPDANGHDGLLDVCTFKQGSLFSGLWYLSGVFLRIHRSMRDCHMVKASRLTIEADEEVFYQLDGDAGGVLPVEIEVLPARVTLLVDRSWAQNNGFEYAAS